MMAPDGGSFVCPRGHSSAEAEFCTVCGARMAAAAEAGAALRQPEPAACPDCGTARGGELGGVFCEICGFNYRTGAHGEIALAEEPVVVHEAVAVEEAVPAVERWSLAVCPGVADAGVPVHTVVLDQPVMMIGRTGGSSGPAPQIDLGFDDGVSRRHALLQRMEDGRYSLRDLSSTNGTFVNGQELTALVDQVLAAGDRILVGRGTTLTVSPARAEAR